MCGMLIQFLIFPPAARYFGVLNCLKTVAVTFPVAYILTPFTALLPNQTAQQVGIFTIMLLKCWAAIFAFPCSTILLTNSAPSLRVLGTLNGVSTSISALGRAAGPAIGGWTFSYGVDIGYVILPWWTLASFAILGAVPVWWLVEMEGFGGGGNDESSDAGDDEAVGEGTLLGNDEDQRSTDVTVAIQPPSEGSRTRGVASRKGELPSSYLTTSRSNQGHSARHMSNRSRI